MVEKDEKTYGLGLRMVGRVVGANMFSFYAWDLYIL